MTSRRIAKKITRDLFAGAARLGDWKKSAVEDLICIHLDAAQYVAAHPPQKNAPGLAKAPAGRTPHSALRPPQ